MNPLTFCIILFLFVALQNNLAQPLSQSLDKLFEQGKAFYADQEYAKATETFNLLIEKGKKKNPYLLSKIYYKLGVFYDTQKNSNKSLECLFKGTKTLKETFSDSRSNIIVPNKDSILSPTQRLSPRDAKLICDIYTRIGGVYYNKEDYIRAEKYWQIAYAIAEDNRQNKPISNLLNNLGEIKRLNSDFHGALLLYKQAFVIKKKIKDSTGLNITMSNIGTTYLTMNVLDSAKLFYDLSYAVALSNNNSSMLMHSSTDYGRYYNKLSKLQKSLYWYNKALFLAQEKKDLNIQLLIYKSLSELYEQRSILDSCLHYQKKWIGINKVVNRQKNEKLALEIEARFLINEKEKELAYLKEKNNIEQQNNQLKDYFQWASIIGLFSILTFTLLLLVLRNKTNKELAANFVKINQQNKEKDILLKEIHHRVKNNLQVITSLLSLQSYNIEDQKTKELFDYSQHRINSMAMIHEMLYQSNDFSKINYNSYLNQLIHKLVTSIKGTDHQIIIKIDVPDLFLNIDTAIPLGLLINEIITNALKYGIPRQSSGTLSIKMTALEVPNFILEIGDNGIGYTGNFKSNKNNSLGLQLIQQLTVQLNGSIEKDLTKKGTNYILNFQEIESLS